jgi:hypothetical protein
MLKSSELLSHYIPTFSSLGVWRMLQLAYKRILAVTTSAA